MAERAPLARLVAGLAAAMVIAQGIAAVCDFPTLGAAALIDPFLASALAGAGLIALSALPPGLRWRALAVAVVAEALLLFSFPWPPDFTQHVVQRGGGGGLVLLGTLAVTASRATGDGRGPAMEALYSALVLPLFVAATGPLLELTALWHPLTLDAPCLAADGYLGQPSFVAGRLFGRLPALGQLCAAIYGELPFFCALVLVLNRRRPEVLVTFVALGVAGYLLYHLFPVAGPRFAAPGWPGRVPAEALRQPPPVPRNCMPSLHTAWVLYCAHHLRGRFLPLAGLFVTGTLLATLGLGLHYAVDLIAALPFVVLVPWLVKRLA